MRYLLSSPTSESLTFNNRIYRDFDCNKDSTETIRKLKMAIDDQSRHLPSTSFSNLISRLSENAIEMFNNDVKYKKIGLTILDTLLDVNDEVVPERRIQIAENIKKLLENDKLHIDTNAEVLRNAAAAIGHLARVASTTEIEYLQNFYSTLVVKWLGDIRSEVRRFSSCLLLRQLAINSPALVFGKRKNFFSALWDVIFDKNQYLREAAGEAIESVVVLFFQRESTDEVIRLALSHMELGFNSAANERLHGGMIIFEAILSSVPSNDVLNTIRNIGKKYPELVWDVLKRKDSKESFLRYKVMDLIPKLAGASSATFVQANYHTSPNNYLSYVMRHLLSLIRVPADRHVAYIALGKLFLSISSTLRGAPGIINDVLNIIKEGFKEPFCIEALQCLSMVVKVSPAIRKFIDGELITVMFQGGLTTHLIECLKMIVKHTPNIRSLVQSRLRNHITNVLLSHSVNVNDTFQSTSTSSSYAGSRNHRSKSQPLRIGFVSSTSSASATVRAAISATASKGNTIRSQAVNWGKDILFGFHHNSNSDPLVFEGLNEDEVVIALDVLSSFELLPRQRDLADCVSLLRVVRDGVVRYLDAYSQAIRDAAAITCAKVVDKVSDVICTDVEERKVLVQVLERLLLLGVGDNVEDIRLHVFQSLPVSIDRLLADSATCVQCLTEALNDEALSVQAAAMSVLARVAHYDVLAIMPLMHLTLSQLMRQINSSLTSHPVLRQESVTLLQPLVQGLNTLIVPYVPQILEPLLTLLDDPSASIVSAALATIGDLASVSPTSVGIHLETLFPRIIDAINDQTSIPKQTVAVVTLGKMVSSLCVTSDAYFSYPGLFESIVRAIQVPDAQATELRIEATKTAGLLGVVGIEQYSRDIENYNGQSAQTTPISNNNPGGARSNKNAEAEEEDADDENTIEIDTTEGVSGDSYYLSVVMKSLMKILKNTKLSAHHQTAASVAMRIVRLLGVESLPQLDLLVDSFVTRIYKSDKGGPLQSALIKNLVSLVDIIGRNIHKHLPLFVKLISDFMDLHLEPCLDMLEALSYALAEQDFNNVFRDALPFIITLIKDEVEPLVFGENEDNPVPSMQLSSTPQIRNPLAMAISTKVAEKKAFLKTATILKSLSNMSPSLGDFRRILIPAILRVMEQAGATASVRRDSLCLVLYLARDSDNLHEFANRIIHPILRTLQSKETNLRSSSLAALSCLICSLGHAYLPFIAPANRAIQSIHVKDNSAEAGPLEEYNNLVYRLLHMKHLPYEPVFAGDVGIILDDSRRSKEEYGPQMRDSLSVGMQALESAWALSGRATAIDLADWIRRLSMEFVRQSPSPILRPCAGLARVHQPLATELFNAAFLSLWDELFEVDQSNVVYDVPIVNAMEQALQSPNAPSSLRMTILNLAEFMETRDKKVPLDIQILARQTERANLLARSLRYREMEFRSPNMLPSSECIEALITINNQLGLREAAKGILHHVKNKFKHISIQPLWLEKLNRWDDAKKAYVSVTEGFRSTHVGSSPLQYEAWMSGELGLLRCLQALGQYEELSAKAMQLQSAIQAVGNQSDKYDTWMCEIQRMGAYAAWNLGKWTDMETFVDGQALSQHHDSHLYGDGTFYLTVLAIQKQDFIRARRFISQIRETMSSTIGSLLSESYARAHQAMVTMQVLTELEELVDYKQSVIKTKVHMETRILNSHSLGSTSPSSATSIASTNANNGFSNNSSISNSSLYRKWLLEAETKKEILKMKWRRRWLRSPKNVDIYRQILVSILQFMIRYINIFLEFLN